MQHSSTTGQGRLLKMNIVQRCFIVAGVSAVLLAGLYAPWTANIAYLGIQYKITVHRFAGYHWMFKPPGPTDAPTFEATFDETDTFRSPHFRDTLQYEVDSSRLLLEWLMVSLVTLGLVTASQ